MSRWWDALKKRLGALEKEISALYWAYRDRRTPWYAKVWVVLVLAYALSPLDLIPDFIPVLGYLDDLVLVPLGVWLALRMIPPLVMAEARLRAQQAQSGPVVPRWLSVTLVVAAWGIAVGVLVFLVLRGQGP